MASSEPLSLDAFAAVTADLQLGASRREALERAAVAEEAWDEGQRRWLERLAEVTATGNLSLHKRYLELLARHRADLVAMDRSPKPSPEAKGPRLPHDRLLLRLGRARRAVASAAAQVGRAPGAPPPVPPSPPRAVAAPRAPVPPPEAVEPAPVSSTLDDPASPHDGALPFAAPSPPAQTGLPFQAPSGARRHPSSGSLPKALPFEARPPSGALPFSPSPRPPATPPPAAPASVAPTPASVAPAPMSSPRPPPPAATLPVTSGSATASPAVPFRAAGSARTTAFEAGGAERALPFAAALHATASPESSAAKPSPSGGLPFQSSAAQKGGSPSKGSSPNDGALPFKGGVVASPPPLSDDLEGTMSLDSSAPLTPQLTLEQFASLTAEIGMHPERRSDIERRYGLDAQTHDHEKRGWAMRFLDDQAVAERYRSLIDEYRSWLQRQR